MSMESCEGNLEGLSLLQHRQALELNLQAIEFMNLQQKAAETAETKLEQAKREQAKLEMQEKGRKLIESMRAMFFPTGMWPVILGQVPAKAAAMGIEISQELLDEYR